MSLCHLPVFKAVLWRQSLIRVPIHSAVHQFVLSPALSIALVAIATARMYQARQSLINEDPVPVPTNKEKELGVEGMCFWLAGLGHRKANASVEHLHLHLLEDMVPLQCIARTRVGVLGAHCHLPPPARLPPNQLRANPDKLLVASHSGSQGLRDRLPTPSQTWGAHIVFLLLLFAWLRLSAAPSQELATGAKRWTPRLSHHRVLQKSSYKCAALE